MVRGPGSLRRRFQPSALISLGLFWRLLTVTWGPLPSPVRPAFPPLLFCCCASWGLVDLSPGFPGKQDYVSHSDPHGSPVLLKSDGVCPVLPGILLEGEEQDPCTESHPCVFILLAQLRGSLRSSPDLRS